MAELRTVCIADLGRVVTGKTPPSAQPELFGKLYPFLTPTDIDGFARYIEPDRFLSPEGRDYQQRLMLPERAVCVVCIGATIGKVCMTGKASFTNQQINSVVVNEDEHDPFFVYHLLTTLRDELKSNAGSATRADATTCLRITSCRAASSAVGRELRFLNHILEMRVMLPIDPKLSESRPDEKHGNNTEERSNCGNR